MLLKTNNLVKFRPWSNRRCNVLHVFRPSRKIDSIKRGMHLKARKRKGFTAPPQLHQVSLRACGKGHVHSV